MQEDPRVIFDHPEKNISFFRKLDQVEEHLNHGVIVEVLNPYHAKMAALAGVKAILVAGQRDPRITISSMADPLVVKIIKESVKIPAMANIRAGHVGEAKILESLQLVNFIEESKFLPPADSKHYINKHDYNVPFACGCFDLGEVLNRVNEGATLIRIQGDRKADTVYKVRKVMKKLNELQTLDDDKVFAFAREFSVPYDLVVKIKQLGKFPVPIFAAGGITTAKDAAFMVHLGCDGVFVGCEVFGIPNTDKILKDMVEHVTHFINLR